MRCVTIDELKGNEILARTIYTDDYQTVLPEGAVLKKEYIQKLQELEIKKVYIKREESFLEEAVILKSEMESVVKVKIKDILERHTYHHNEELMELSQTVDAVIGSILEEPEVIEQVYDIKERNADIYEHSLSLCTLAVLVGARLQLSQQMLHDIGVGCLLHDIGLRYLAIDYKNQNLSTLSEADMIEYKKHPVYGYTALREETWLSDISKTMILYHHEKIDGSGYPLHATELPIAVQIISVCDTFDEMICGIGCDKVKVYEAVEYLKTFKNLKYSGTIIYEFLQFTAVYPVGTKVVTTDGVQCVVVKQNKEFPDRPILMVLQEDESSQEVVLKDLMKEHKVFIEKVLD